MRRPDRLHRHRLPHPSHRPRKSPPGLLPAAARPLRRAARPADRPDLCAGLVGRRGAYLLGDTKWAGDGVFDGGDGLWG